MARYADGADPELPLAPSPLSSKLRASNPNLHVTCDVRMGDPDEGILAAELDRQIDLVVMATHARTGIDRARVGSVACKIVREGRAPVMLVPPPVQEQSQLDRCGHGGDLTSGQAVHDGTAGTAAGWDAGMHRRGSAVRAVAHHRVRGR
jgi:hypothetical protein